MNLKKLATDIVLSKLGGVGDSDRAKSALDSLADSGKGFDIAELVGKFEVSGGDLADKAKSWLGDGGNDSLSSTEVMDAIGIDKVEAFAAKLNLDRDSAGQKLAEILPELVDKSSRGGELLGSAGGIGGLAGFASRLFRKSA